jgi:hypothetical protein
MKKMQAFVLLYRTDVQGGEDQSNLELFTELDLRCKNFENDVFSSANVLQQLAYLMSFSSEHCSRKVQNSFFKTQLLTLHLTS